ncbi:MAG: response regulator [Oscillospiraceae bacterium]|nr:response regulator [Oscillospiraceae bacterium]
MKVSFGESLRRLRMERNISQQQLANLLHVDRSTIAKWESGTRLPDADMITRLSDCLSAEPGRLLLQASEKNAEKWNVMLVDDEKIILSGALPVLSKALPEAEIHGFTDPAEAAAFAGANKVQLTFLDIEMGRISGLDVCRNLLEINPRMNVIFLTGYREYALDAWETGACGFLVKPITVEAVRRRLSALRFPTMTI